VHAQLDPDIENARLAIEWALSHDEILPAARILAGFAGPFQRLIGATEVRRLLGTALERLDAAAQPALAVRTWRTLAHLSVGSRTVEAAQRALELAEQCDDLLTTIDCLCTMAFGLLQSARGQEVQPLIDRALELSKEGGLTGSPIHAQVLNTAAIGAVYCGRIDEAEQVFAEALARYTALGDEGQAMEIRLNMAELEFEKGNAAGALELVKAIECQVHTSRNERTRVGALVNGAAYRIALGDILGARSAAREALRLARGVLLLEALGTMQHLATIAALSGAARHGARLRGYVDASYRNVGFELQPTEQRMRDILTTALREKLDEAEIESLAAEGAQLSEDQAVVEAMAV
jgi:tetratricopeptide (TPR) repeat protein